ncbi:MAG: hypothetical protein KZQ92_22660 [Candidatus Thiodiazotropha sp. (ex Lucinoma borealis)]|nr:hypothetical protein [Candidatus Thiodiazotropha sp. (ex Lucinoma borealis)]
MNAQFKKDVNLAKELLSCPDAKTAILANSTCHIITQRSGDDSYMIDVREQAAKELSESK